MKIRRLVDEHAVRIPQQSGLLPCLYIPVAARDAHAIEAYVGRIVTPLGAAGKAFLVDAHEPETPDTRLGIWNLPEAAVLHVALQVWVHVDYRAYRRAYVQAFPTVVLGELVLDHVMNRRVARLKGFAYLRIVPISRAANSSHGGLSEGWAVDHHSSPAMQQRNAASPAMVQYADLADIVKMLNRQGGGSYMEAVNDAQQLVDLPSNVVR
jgi:hypothetical protein